MNDAQLLQEFTRRGSDQAFRELVDRHLPLVLGTARRLTSDSALAEEIAQTVFVLLARKASKLSSGVILSGWLYRTTRFVTNRALVSEQRRKRREEEAALMTNQTDSDPVWKEIAPQLDDALGRLGETDRSALLLRFFEQSSMRDVGQALGLSEEAAKKRVNRALEKLRGIVKHRGIEISATALAAGLTREQAKAGVTPALSATISSAALSQLALGTGSAAGTGLVADVLAAWRWAKIKTGLAGAAAIVGVTLLIPVGLEQFNRKTPAPHAIENQIAQSAEQEVSTALNGSDLMDSLADLPVRELTVTVLDAATGEPIPNTRLRSNFSISIQGVNKGEAMTDERGIGQLLVPESLPGFDMPMQHLEISVLADGYAPRQISWLHPAGDVLNFVSSEYTVRLEPGITLSGTVVDEKGTPLRGLRVGASGSNYQGYSTSYEGDGKPIYSPEFKEEDYATFSVRPDTSGADAISTDNNGRFVIRNFPSDLRSVNLELMAEDGARRKFRTPIGMQPAEQIPEISFEELRAGTARLEFSTGLTVDGIVVDANGFPVPLAEVIEGTQWGNLKIQSRTHTDHNGHFRLKDRKPREIILAASAAGHGSVSTVVSLEPGMAAIRLRLPGQMPLRGRVVTETGEPVTDARVVLVDYLNTGLGLEFEGTTDSSGRFVWLNAPTNEVNLLIMSSGARLRARPEEHTIVLRTDAHGKVLITGTVVDAESLLPLDEFTVQIRSERIQGSNGRFEKELSMRDFAPGTAPTWTAKVSAEGYEEAESREHHVQEGDQILEFQLKPGGTVAGRVWTPAGQPAPEAEIAFTPRERPVISFRPAQLDRWTAGMIRSGVDGQFKLTKPRDARGVVAMHDSGFALISLDHLTESADVQLMPWGKVQGIAMAGGEPLAGIEIRLASVGLSGLIGWADYLLQIAYQTTTDSRGSFVFEQVPEGTFIAGLQANHWQRTGESHVTALERKITIRAGQTKNIQLASQGAAVSARLSLPSGDRIHTNDLLAVLKRDVALPTQPARADYIHESSWQEARRRFSRDPHTMAALAESRSFVGETSEEGEVFFMDVPPGRYILEASFFAPAESSRQRAGDPHQSPKTHRYRAAVNVPESAAEEGVFLGDFTLEPLQ
jgi:RNA polymerase sigma factor (sigma-70 family)